MSTAKGTFEVTVDRQPPYDINEGAALGRTSIRKQFRGELTGESSVEMLSAGSLTVKGSAGYVAIERVTGTMGGRAGTFVLQHSGTMKRGQATLQLSVVPDTGTGALTGITGSMTIDIIDGQHHYVFTYDFER
jgi:hypothetical protein